MQHGYPCPHCGQSEPTPPPQPFRRTLVLLVGLGLFAVSGIDALLLALVALSGAYSLSAAIGLVLGAWGFIYCTYLWVSFILIGSLRLPGCEFTALSHFVSRRHTHRCVDSVLNSVLDDEEKKHGLDFPLLLKTESAQKWTGGFILLFVFAIFLALGFSVGRAPRLDFVGVFALVYIVYDKTIHRVSIGKRWLTGSGDYTKIVRGILSGKLE